MVDSVSRCACEVAVAHVEYLRFRDPPPWIYSSTIAANRETAPVCTRCYAPYSTACSVRPAVESLLDASLFPSASGSRCFLSGDGSLWTVRDRPQQRSLRGFRPIVPTTILLESPARHTSQRTSPRFRMYTPDVRIVTRSLATVCTAYGTTVRVPSIHTRCHGFGGLLRSAWSLPPSVGDHTRHRQPEERLRVQCEQPSRTELRWCLVTVKLKRGTGT